MIMCLKHMHIYCWFVRVDTQAMSLMFGYGYRLMHDWILGHRDSEDRTRSCTRRLRTVTSIHKKPMIRAVTDYANGRKAWQ